MHKYHYYCCYYYWSACLCFVANNFMIWKNDASHIAMNTKLHKYVIHHALMSRFVFSTFTG